MRISDWSSDVCSSDLAGRFLVIRGFLSVSKKRVLLFTMGSWSHSNDALVKALHHYSPDWEIHTFDLLQKFKAHKLGLFFGLLEIGRATCRERVCQYV